MTDYCTIEDIETQTSTPTLIQLTSDDGQEEVDRVVAQEAILYSSTLIDGYLRGRYTLPLDTHFPLLRILAIDLSIYRLYTRRMRNEMPEVIENNYKNAIATLRDIQKGVITLQSENDSLETASFNAEEYKTNKDIIDRLFSKERMLEY
nr:MAG TPA: head to tail adaptor [Caudoviricetes sp.]